MANDKMTVCKHCGAEIAAKAKTCPNCGGKNKKPIFKRIWFWLIIVVLLIFIIAIAGSGNQYEVSDDATKMPEKDYKSACQEIEYKELMRNAEDLTGTKVKLNGEVNQVVFESDSGSTESQYKVAVTKDEFDFYTDDIILYYQRGDSPKIIEDDILTIYGEVSGTESYTSVLGEEITVPVITGVYVSVDE